ncbi:MAG: Ig-like domain-containing protein, partial [Tannerella sp.]|nr:Ig-like domain-containing protein [Tannerella sp.]
PANATNRNIIWKTDNDRIATIDQTGKITGIAAGKITVSAIPEEDESRSKSCIIQVD